MDSSYASQIVARLERIALAAERIAAALEKQNDPMRGLNHLTRQPVYVADPPGYYNDRTVVCGPAWTTAAQANTAVPPVFQIG